MINDTVNGYYSAAVACAAMTTFVFVAIIDSFRPIILEYKVKNEEKYRDMLRLLYSVIKYISVIQSVLFFCLATPIVRIIFGESYSLAIPLLRVVAWYTPFSYLGVVRNVWILAENKAKFLWIINLSSVIVNVTTNLALIPIMGAMGAAIASLLSNFITIVVICYVVRPLRENAKLMFASFNPRILTNAIKLIKNKI